MIGRAGRKGEDVRSDCHVEVEPRDGGGIELEVRSKVKAYYGEPLREQVRAELERLGVAHARVAVDDAGALPFVVSARVEAAVLGAGMGTFPITKIAMGNVPISPRDRVRRSRLYLPGNEPKFMINAGLHGPDGVILDLEDSVHPDEKDAARILVREALRALDFFGCERMVRINQGPRGLADLDAVVPVRPDLVLLPKVEDPDEVRAADLRIDAALGGEDRPVWLMPILESARGLERAFEIATASPRVAALTIGLEDLTADLGAVKTPGGEETAWHRARLLNAARAAGVQAIDSVWGDVGDLDGLRAWGERARRQGFDGMGCVHPSQIRVVHEAFAPSPAELERARRIVEAFQDAQSRGLAVVSLGSKMIDPPVVERARRLVRRAERAGVPA